VQCLQQVELQRLGERFLDSPHRVEEPLALGIGDSLQSAGLGVAERVAGYPQHVARPVQFQVDTDE
jgi:hypothetical protein